MCTDLRLVRLDGMHVSARTLDFGYETHSRVQVVPRGQDWSATATDDHGDIDEGAGSGPGTGDGR